MVFSKGQKGERPNLLTSCLPCSGLLGPLRSRMMSLKVLLAVPVVENLRVWSQYGFRAWGINIQAVWLHECYDARGN